jgi:putative membrane protein
VPGFGTAFWGALVYSLLTWLVSLALADDDGRKVKMVFRSRRD